MYLISVYFDDKSNKIISNYINKIAQKTGNTFMTDNHVPPHLTIMSVEAREEKKLTEVMEQLERCPDQRADPAGLGRSVIAVCIVCGTGSESVSGRYDRTGT